MSKPRAPCLYFTSHSSRSSCCPARGKTVCVKTARGRAAGGFAPGTSGQNSALGASSSPQVSSPISGGSGAATVACLITSPPQQQKKAPDARAILCILQRRAPRRAPQRRRPSNQRLRVFFSRFESCCVSERCILAQWLKLRRLASVSMLRRDEPQRTTSISTMRRPHCFIRERVGW